MNPTSDEAIIGLDNVIHHLGTRDSESIESCLSKEGQVDLYRQIAIMSALSLLSSEKELATKFDPHALGQVIGYFSELIKSLRGSEENKSNTSDLN